MQTPKSNMNSTRNRDDHEMEIAGMPTDIDEAKLRQFLAEHIGENNEKILSIVLSNESGYISTCDLTKCFISFQDEKSMLESIESLKGIGYDGYSLTVHRRKLKLPTLNTPGIASMRNNAGGGGENSGPIFLTNTPKNFEAATNFQK